MKKLPGVLLLLLSQPLAAWAQPASNLALEAHPVPLLQRTKTAEEYNRWFSHAPGTLGDAESARVGAIPLHNGGPSLASQVVGNIFVVEGTTSLVLSVDQSGRACSGSNCYKTFNTRGGAVENVANQVRQSLGDNFDEIVIWTAFKDYAGGAFYAPLQNDVSGLGVCNPNDQSGQDGLFGCKFDQTGGAKVQGLIYMNAVETWKEVDGQFQLTYTEDDFRSQVYSVLGQESTHRWLAGFHVPGSVDSDPKLMLGRDKSHWNLKLDTNASVLDGLDWEDLGGGNFQIVGDNDGYSALDMYAIGLVGADEVEPFFFVKNAYSARLKQIYAQFGQNFDGNIPNGNDELFIPPIEVVGALPATGNRVDISMEKIIVANGQRNPTVATSQKDFKQVFVLVTLPGQSISAAQGAIDQLETVRSNWETWFSQKTGGRGSMCTAVTADCSVPKAEIVDLRVGSGDGNLVRGQTSDLYVSLANTGSRVIPAVAASLGVSSGGASVDVGAAQVTNIPGGGQVESATAFRVSLPQDLDCGTSSVVVKVTLDPVGSQEDGREFSLAVKACDSSSSSSSGGVALPFGPNGVRPCACAAIPSASSPVWGLALLGLLLGRRRKA